MEGGEPASKLHEEHKSPLGAEQITRAELPPLTEAQQALLEALTLPEEVRRPLEQQYDDKVADVKARFVQPRQKQIIDGYAAIDKFDLFGASGSQLPTELVLVKSSGLQVQVRPDLRITRPRELLDLLDIGNSQIEEALAAAYEARKPQIDAALRRVIEESPACALVKSFDTQLPVEAETPLTELEKQTRAAQEEKRIRDEYGIAANVGLDSQPAASRQLRQYVHRLDQETAQRRQPEREDGKDRFWRWATQSFLGWVNRTPDDYGGGVTALEMPQNSDSSIKLKLADGAAWGVDDEFRDWQSDLLAHEYPTNIYSKDTYEPDEWFIHDMMFQFHQANTLRQAIDAAVQAGVDYYSQDYNLLKNAAFFALQSPRGAMYESTDLVNIPAQDVRFRQNSNVRYMSQQALEHLHNRSVGTVEKTPPDGITRLIMKQPCGRYPFTAHQEPDMKLRLSGAWGNDEPYIPGYVVVAKDGQNWSFVRDELDPYHGAAEVVLPNYRELMYLYRAMGLVELADALEHAPSLNAVELTELIRNQSDYSFDQNMPPLTVSGFNPENFQKDFTPYVKNGRLQVQCTGASAFLAASLEIALPECRASQVGGQVLGQLRRISAAEHAQTLLTTQGQSYILDPTPPAPDGIDATGGVGAARAAAEPQQTGVEKASLPKPSGNSQVDMSKVPQVDLDELMGETKQSQVESVRNRLEHELRIMTDSPNNDQLYAKIARLKQDDPLRRALTAVIQLGANDSTMLQVAQQYIQSYMNADVATLRRTGLPHYEPTVLSIVATTLQSYT